MQDFKSLKINVIAKIGALYVHQLVVNSGVGSAAYITYSDCRAFIMNRLVEAVKPKQ